MAVTDPDPVTQIHTVVETNPPQDLGLTNWRESALVILQEMHVSDYTLDDNGYLTSFTPVLDPVQGVSFPPANTPLRYVAFNNQGRLSAWEAYSEEELPACSVQKIDNGPNLPPTYKCITNSCPLPSHCVVTYHEDPTGNVLSVTCDCIDSN
jgi:hypothetical protein